jgi:peptidoglycan/LPS O-acetylase OafA/YrhL
MGMKRLSQLDGIRGLAVAAVLITHLGDLSVVGIAKTAATSAMHRLLKPGWMGVDIFFVLSGFLITSIILKERSRPNFWSSFYMRRAFRILPAFLTVYVVTLLATHFFSAQTPITASYLLMSIFFLANWTVLTGNQLELLFHIWSLAVEEQFYFLWPQAAKRLKNATLFQVALFLAVASECCRIVLTMAHVTPYVLYEITPTRLDGICVGSALAAGVTLPRVERFLSRWWKRIALTAAVLLIGLFAAFRGDLNPFRMSSQIYAIPAVVVLTAMLIFGAVESTLPAVLDRFFSNGVMTYLGRRSYGLYLIHDPIRVAVSNSRESGSLSSLPRTFGVNLLLAVGVAAVSLILTELSWRLIESPAQDLRRRLTESREYGAPSRPAEEAAITELSTELKSEAEAQRI